MKKTKGKSSKKKADENTKTQPPNTADVLADLLEYAEKKRLPSGAFDDDIWDTIEGEAKLVFEGLRGNILYDQLEYLYAQGYSAARLRELIDEYGKEGTP